MEHSYVAIYYRQHPTKTMLFANKTALDNFINSTRTGYYEKDGLNGCVITKNTGYVDLEIEDTDYSDIRKAGWIWVYNYDNNVDKIDSYYGFISDVQLNNFTEDKNILYVRVTFDIDWWHTLLASGDLDQSKLYGQVNRAHVNDLIRREDDKIYPTLKYTFDAPEELVIRKKRISYEAIYPKDNLIGEVYYLYIVVRNSPERNITQDFPLPARKTYVQTPQALVGVLPIYDRAFIAGVFNVQDVSAPSPTTIFALDGTLNINNLSDDDIISMFISSIPPVPYSSVSANGSNITFSNTVSYNIIELDYRRSGDTVSKIKVPCFSTYSYYTFNVDSFISSLESRYLEINFWGENNKYKPFYKDSVISFTQEQATSFEYYLSTIVKYRSHAYNPIYLYLSDDILFQSIFYNRESVIYIQNVTSLGGLVYSFPESDYYYGDERVDYDISTSRVYTPLVYLTSEQLNKANLEVAKGVGDIFNAVASLATGGGVLSDYSVRANNWLNAGANPIFEPTGGGVAGFAIKGVAGAYNSAISAVGRFQDSKIMRKGKVGKSSNQPFASQVPDSFFSVVCETPEDSEQSVILEHLAIYGYNTFLDLHDILLNHQRNYFNYIQSIDCMYNEPSLREDIREYIQNMFNNGVWLWHTAVNFGNFNIPNWQVNM